MSSEAESKKWVEDCPSGILSDCFIDKKKKKVLTETQAAFKNYDEMLGTGETEEIETFNNYQSRSCQDLIWLVILLILVAFFLKLR